jgi:hypothetical protein
MAPAGADHVNGRALRGSRAAAHLQLARNWCGATVPQAALGIKPCLPQNSPVCPAPAGLTMRTWMASTALSVPLRTRDQAEDNLCPALGSAGEGGTSAEPTGGETGAPEPSGRGPGRSRGGEGRGAGRRLARLDVQHRTEIALGPRVVMVTQHCKWT